MSRSRIIPGLNLQESIWWFSVPLMRLSRSGPTCWSLHWLRPLPFLLQRPPDQFIALYYQQALDRLDAAQYTGERIVIKGCSDYPVPPFAYALLTARLQPYAQSILFGEALFDGADLQAAEGGE